MQGGSGTTDLLHALSVEKGLGVYVPMGSTDEAGASPSAALLQECVSPARAEQVGCCLQMQDGVPPPLAGCSASGIEEHPQRGSMYLPRGRQGGLSGQGGLSRQAPGAAIGFCWAMLSLSIQ